MENELVATFTLRRGSTGKHYLRLQDARGKWQEISLDRYTSVGWNELRLLWSQLAQDLTGENQLPF
jgi:hypothetical protein